MIVSLVAAEYQIDQRRNCVFSKASGFVNDEDLLQHQRRLREDPAFRPDLKQLWDVRNLDRIDVSAKAILALARNNPFGKGSKRALVVDSPLAYGLSRMFQAYVDNSPDEVEIFKDHDAGLEWLDLQAARGSWTKAPGNSLSRIAQWFRR